jgi:hypothetical protein
VLVDLPFLDAPLPSGRQKSSTSPVPELFRMRLDKVLFISEGRQRKAHQVFQHILQLQQWGAFGYIAAEIELAR